MTHATKVLGGLLLFSFLLNLHAAETFPLVSTNATWRFRKGLGEASTPDITAWRTNEFNESGFVDSAAPFTYGENYAYGTLLNDMMNGYGCFFLRRQFVVTNLAEVAALRLGAKVDDGFVAWINGSEVRRVNMPGAPGDPVFVTTLSTGTPSEPVPFVFYDLNSATNYLREGTNVLAVQVFNVTSNSTDLVFDCSLDALLTETNPPVIASVIPAPGNITTLTQIVVHFSEPVTGVSAGDLVVNSVPSSAVTGSGSNYTFTFPQPQYGLVYITWATNSGIADTAIPPNPFNETAPESGWQYTLTDVAPPTVAELRPAAGTTVRVLGEVRVTFSEGVANVGPTDLLMNGVAATNVINLPGSVFLFQFAPASPGNVQLTWAVGHGITDLAPSPNPFSGTTWGYVVDPNASLSDVVINEFLAANATGIGDANGNNGDPEPLSWIELYNRGAGTIDLAGWSLTDDSSFPDKWIFPAKTIGPGEYLIVFASGLDIRNATGTNRLHTNFKLSRSGEFLGLYSPDSPPTLVSGFNYPEQRNDYSYGTDFLGQLRYFSPSTPGAANGGSAIAGVVEPVHFNVARGHFTSPFDLVLSCPTRGSQIRYTTNGSEPTLTTGLPYQGPLRITTSAMIRAAAFRTNMLPSRIATHSYFFNLPLAQRSLPVISIVTDQNNMTGPNGIIGISNVVLQGDIYVPADGTGYHNPSRHGIAWERPTSVELIRFPDNSGFQTEAGIRVQGSDYQRPRTTVSSKFSFRLYFRSVYGDGRLNYPMFPLATSQEFDQIVLRAGFNENNNPFIRDELTRRLSHDMGNVASHGTLASLFVNGVYKGFYNPCERVHEEFMQSYLGGSEDWDVVGPSFATGAGVPGVIDGDRNNFVGSLVGYINTANVNDPATYAEIGRRLDLPNFVDYCLLNAYCAMGDWPQNNWRAGKDRSTGPWRFIVWDAEWSVGIYGRAVTLNAFTMSGPGPNEGGLSSVGDSEIAQIYQRLRNSPEFRLLFADRVHKHMFNNGALTDANITNRFGQLRTEMAGNFSMLTDIIDGWVPQRRGILFSQMIPLNIMASSNAPVLNQHGGRVPAGFQLTMAATNHVGTIYYTTNGTDPRVPYSGAVSNAALTYSGPITLDQNVVIKARTFSAAGWSALSEAKFEVALLGVPIRITEIHYNPSQSPNYEFLELMNIGGSPVDLSGAYFDGIEFTFGLGSIIQPGSKIVLATSLNPSSFTNRYPGVSVFGYFGGGLNNAADRITLFEPSGNIITSVSYLDASGWPEAADGRGSSLQIVDIYGDPNDPANWRASTTLGGTPGTIPAPAPLPDVRLNEVLADNAGAVANAGTFPDYVELENVGAGVADLAGWSLTDDGNERKFVFPPGTTIAAGERLLVWCDDTTNTTPGFHTGFALGRNGDTVLLYNANTNLVDAISFGLQLANHSIGRIGNAWTLNAPTPSNVNATATLGSAASLSINEFLANPIAGSDDWLELFNSSALPVAVRGCFLATTTAVHHITSLSFIPPFGFVQLIADENPGPDHLNFKLPAGGGSIILYDAMGAEVNRVNYTGQTEGVARGRLPDGSVNLVNFPGTASPGASNYTATYSGPVINEVLARNVRAVTNAGRVADYIEIYNPNTTNFPLAGMSLSVNTADAGEWIFPPGASIGAQSYLVIWCDGGRAPSTNPGDYNTGESLDGESGGAYLFNLSGQLVNSAEYGFQVADLPIGLVAGTWRLLGGASPGAANGTASPLGLTTALRVNEWMADAVGEPDWFELFNSTNLPVDLSGLVLTDDPTISGTNEFRVAPLTFIGAAGFVQWIADAQVDDGRDHVSFSLDVEGDTIRLYASNGSNVLDSVAFGSQRANTSQGRWPDGSAVIASFAGSPTPGESNYRLVSDVVINELLTHASGEQMIELRNVSGETANIGGWFLSDDGAALKKFRITDGTILTPGAITTFSQSQFNTGSNAFLLDRARGGELWLSEANVSGVLTGYRTRVRFGAAAQDVSFGRFQISGLTEFVAQSARTFGNTNAGPLIGPMIINEIMYNPPGSIPGATEFIEIHNSGGAPVDLFDTANPANTWKLGDAVEFTFPPGISIGAGGYLLVVDFNPVIDPGQLASFRAYYGVSPSVPVLGPYSGRLDNTGDSVELLKPDLPLGSFVPYVLVDEVNYRDSAPWPSGAVDGDGFSLQRRSFLQYGNDPAAWRGTLPSAGSGNNPGAAGPPTIVQSPTGTNALVNTELFLQAAATGSGPLLWQWRFNGLDLPGATNSSLAIDYLRLDDSGTYDVFVRNSSGPAFSAPAEVTVVEPPVILTAPPSLYSTNAGSNVTFSVTYAGSPPLQLQWWKDGVEIPGANSTSLTIPSVGINEMAQYSFTVSNLYGVASSNITLVVLIRPGITNNPVPQTVVQGGTAIFQVTGGPIHPLLPITYRWLRQGVFWPSPGLPTLVITNCHPTNNGGFRCQLINAAGNVTTVSVNLTVLPDFDGDGMGDAWETNYFGLSTNNSGDGVLDFDDDGMSNRDEFVAGTNPTNSASVLRLSLTTNTSVLRFTAESNRFYAVEYRTNLVAAPWSTLTNIAGSTLVRTAMVHSPNPPPQDERYYRILTPASP